MPPQPSSASNSSLAGWGKLIALAATMGFLWTAVLPAVSRWPVVQDRFERHQAIGLDPSAKFYTEMEFFPASQLDLRSRQRGKLAESW